MVLISGENRDTKAATNNGAGKSSVPKALTWGLYGDTLDGDKHDEVIRWGEKVTEVFVLLSAQSGEWEVVRSRSKGKPDLKLHHRQDAKRLWEEWRGDAKELQAKIVELVGLDFRGFCNTVLYGQGDLNRFFSSTDIARKETLHRILRTDIYRAAEKIARERAHDMGTQREELSNRAKVLEANMLGVDVERLKSESAEFEQEREERVSVLTKDISSCAETVKKIGTAYEVRSNQLRKQQQDAEKSLKVLKSKESQVVNDLATLREKRAVRVELEGNYQALQQRINYLQGELGRLRGDRCPVCTAPLNSGVPAQHRKTLQSSLESEKTNKATLEAKRTQLDQELKIWGNEVEQRSKEHDREALVFEQTVQQTSLTLTNLLEEVEGDKEFHRAIARGKLAEVKKLMVEPNRFQTLLESVELRRAEILREIDEVKRDLEKLSGEKALVDFWVKGFGVQGLPSLVLDSTMPFLTSRANHYLRTLSDGDISLSISTQRELKSKKGELKDELTISWVIEGVPDVRPSNGQRRKMEIAVDLALMDLVSKREGTVDLIILDEVLDGLDSEGKARVFLLLKELRERRGSIFVVTHEPELTEQFERNLHVVKQGGASIVKEVR
jgi:DNA repair exonuclease SbcCD ATPase subunit